MKAGLQAGTQESRNPNPEFLSSPFTVQPELFDAADPKNERNVQWLVDTLRRKSESGEPWMTSRELLELVGMEADEDNKRMIRGLSEASQGRVIGHQRGYALTAALTAEQYQHWRNEWLKSSESIRAKIVAADIVFYARAAA